MSHQLNDFLKETGLDEEILEHSGIKGMRWGVRKIRADAVKGFGKTKGKIYSIISKNKDKKLKAKQEKTKVNDIRNKLIDRNEREIVAAQQKNPKNLDAAIRRADIKYITSLKKMGIELSPIDKAVEKSYTTTKKVTTNSITGKNNSKKP